MCNKFLITCVTLLCGAFFGESVRGGGLGICYDPNETCSSPCPAELACLDDVDCPQGYICPLDYITFPYCECTPQTGEWYCYNPGGWMASVCIPTPEPTGPRGYSIIDLGTLGGWTGVGNAINNLGQVAGEADTTSGYRHACLWDNGEEIDLGVLNNHNSSYAVDINNHGAVVCNSGINTGTKAFLWEAGAKLYLGDFGGGSSARGFNDVGQVVGVSYLQHGASHSFLWQNGVMTDLYLTRGISGAVDINNGGEMACYTFVQGQTHAAVCTSEETIDVGTLGGQRSAPVTINDAMQLAGSSERSPGGNAYFYGFISSQGELVDLGALGGLDGQTSIGALNNCGQVVFEVNWNGKGYLYDPIQGVRDLTTFIPAEERWHEISPRGMNDRGQIVGVAVYWGPGVYHGITRPFLMTPTPGDVQFDGDIDLRDFVGVQNGFTGELAPGIPGCNRADIDGDADVDLFDLTLFVNVISGPRR